MSDTVVDGNQDGCCQALLAGPWLGLLQQQTSCRDAYSLVRPLTLLMLQSQQTGALLSAQVLGESWS